MWRTNQPAIDPQWAWSAYDGLWTRREAAHLFRRAGFAASHEELQSATQQTTDEAVASLVHDRGSDAFQSEMESLARTVLATNNPQGLANWWLYRILHTPDPLLEKTTLFWHGHFATSADKVQDTELMYQQNQTLRTNALGEFEPMVQAISRDPAMLIYLDSVTNRKAHPNENYARELMELFCLGEGNYSEQDVQQLARCFTGWEVRRKVFYFNRFQHDTGTKKILGQEGKFGGEQAVRIVLQHPSAAQFISAKLVHYFVMDEPRVDAVLIEPLAQQLRENGFVIGPVIERILNSQLFFSEWSVGRKIRSPIEMAMGMLRALNATTNIESLVTDLRNLGHGLLFPPNVKGWDGGRTWINSSTLLGRANLVGRILYSDRTKFAGGTLHELLNGLRIRSAEDRVDWLAAQMLATRLPATVHQQLIEVTGRNGGGEESLKEAIQLISTLPEFHLN